MALRRARYRDIPLIFLVPSKHSGCEKVVILVVSGASVVMSLWSVRVVDSVAFGGGMSEVDGSRESGPRGRKRDIYAIVVDVG